MSRRSVEGKPDFEGFYLDDNGYMVRKRPETDACGYTAADRAHARKQADRERARITNTTKEASENPLGMLGILMGGVTRGIEEQERNGQGELVKSVSLPAKMRSHTSLHARADFEKMGIKFGEASSKDDALFIDATLPPGWKKSATGHSLWSKLLDDKGRERASIFYKAAFYDRDAFMDISVRFRMNMDYNRDDYETVRAWQVLDGGKVVFEKVLPLPDNLIATLKEHPYDPEAKARREVIDQQGRDACQAWLDERYPNWKDPTAHWDDE